MDALTKAGRRTTRTRARPSPAVLGAAVALVVVGAALALYAGGGDDGPFTPVSGFSHAHGVAVHPTDPTVLYVATHHGLVRGVNDSSWARVGASEDDFMGFTLHPRDASVMWSSGHPKVQTATFHNLGVRKSTDGGVTWRDLPLRGVDFHAMTVSGSEPDKLYGVYRGEVYRSVDGGERWTVVGDAPPDTVALTAHPLANDVLYAATARGILGSRDGGETWLGIADGGVAALAIDPRDPRTWYASSFGGGVTKSEDSGRTWRNLTLDAQVLYLAVAPSDPRIVYAVTAESAVHKSEDGGESWREVKPASSA